MLCTVSQKYRVQLTGTYLVPTIDKNKGKAKAINDIHQSLRKWFTNLDEINHSVRNNRTVGDTVTYNASRFRETQEIDFSIDTIIKLHVEHESSVNNKSAKQKEYYASLCKKLKSQHTRLTAIVNTHPLVERNAYDDLIITPV